MSPYDIVGVLIAPLPTLALLVAMALSSAVFNIFTRGTFAQVGGMRIVIGYLGALVSMALVSVTIVAANGGLTLGNFIGVFVFLAYMACWMVAVIVLPLTIMLTACGRGIVGWILLACSAVGAPAFTVLRYFITARDIGGVTAQQWAYDLLGAAVLMMLVSGSFLIGARLPWTK